jgi:thioredoxin-like negative regulator of GroEL
MNKLIRRIAPLAMRSQMSAPKLMVAQRYPMFIGTKFNFSTRPPDWSPVASDAAEADTINHAKEFIKGAKEASPITELQKLSDWQPEVMESPVPVILDCYADWCAPCKTLEPRLREKVLSYKEGQLKLVKLNIDNFPQLSTGLNIKQIPAVFLIFKGNVVDMFQGLPEDKIFDEFFNTALLLNSMATDQNIMEDVMAKVKQMITDSDLAQAEVVLADSYQLEEWRSKYGTQMMIGLAYCRLFKTE